MTAPATELPVRFNKYENHASRYLTVDGTRIHHRDERQGPALVLLHAVMASLLTRGAESADRLTKTIRNLDEKAWTRLKATKHTYDVTDAERQEWRTVFVKVAKDLRGTVFNPQLFDRVIQLSGNPLAN